MTRELSPVRTRACQIRVRSRRRAVTNADHAPRHVRLVSSPPNTPVTHADHGSTEFASWGSPVRARHADHGDASSRLVPRPRPPPHPPEITSKQTSHAGGRGFESRRSRSLDASRDAGSRLSLSISVASRWTPDSRQIRRSRVEPRPNRVSLRRSRIGCPWRALDSARTEAPMRRDSSKIDIPAATAPWLAKVWRGWHGPRRSIAPGLPVGVHRNAPGLARRDARRPAAP